MITLSNGYKLPDTGDFGDSWFPALEDNIQRVNDHSHNGVNSEIIDGVNIKATTATIFAGDFSASGDQFETSVTLPSAALVDETNISFRDPTTKAEILLEIEKISVSQIKVYTHFVQDFEVVYS